MKLKNDFILKDILDSHVAVGLAKKTDDFNGVINLNETGMRIFQLIQQGKDVDDIVATLLQEYDAPEDVIRTEVLSIVEKLKSEGILEV